MTGLEEILLGAIGTAAPIGLAVTAYLVKVEHRLTSLETKINYLVPDKPKVE